LILFVDPRDGSELHLRHHGLITELECVEMCTLGRNTCHRARQGLISL